MSHSFCVHPSVICSFIVCIHYFCSFLPHYLCFRYFRFVADLSCVFRFGSHFLRISFLFISPHLTWHLYLFWTNWMTDTCLICRLWVWTHWSGRPHIVWCWHMYIVPRYFMSIATAGMPLLENDIVMSSSLFMLITYYSVMTDTNEHDWHSLDIFLLYLLG